MLLCVLMRALNSGVHVGPVFCCVRKQFMRCVQAQAAVTGNLLPTKGKGKKKQAAGKASSKAVKAATGEQSEDDQEDVLQDYELSDDSEMED